MKTEKPRSLAWRSGLRQNLVWSLLLSGPFLSVPLWFSAGLLYGQRITARIVGTVPDPTGAVVPNANVAGTNVGTQLTFHVPTNSEGYYVLTALPVGEYALTVEAAGFRKLERTGIHLDIDQTARVDLRLELGAAAETVTIAAEAPRIDSENVAVNTLIDRKQITELPTSFVGARTIMDWMLTGAGQSTSQNEPYENANYSYNGSPQNTQTTTLDGASIAVPGTNTWYLIRPPVEEVREVQIQTGTFSPEAGGFAAINMGTVSGTNNFHGAGFFFFQNQDLVARMFFQPFVPDFPRKEAGWTVTGPVIKNRTFFTYSYDGYWSSKPQSPIITVPVDQIKSGNFQGIGNIFDPATTRPNPDGPGYIRDPFPNNQIPAARMDPVALKLMGYWPEPNISGDKLVNNYNSQLIGQGFDQTMPNTAVKIDQKMTDHNQFFARYQHIGGGFIGEATFPSAGDYTGLARQTHGNIVTFVDTHTFSPRMVNEFRFGFFHISTKTQHYKADGQDIPTKIGLKNVSTSQFPLISVSGVIPLVLGPRDGQNFDITENYQWSDHVTYIRGAHILKAGGNVMIGSLNPYSLGRPSGQFQAPPQPDLEPGLTVRSHLGPQRDPEHDVGFQPQYDQSGDQHAGGTRLRGPQWRAYEVLQPNRHGFTSYRPCLHSEKQDGIPGGLLNQLLCQPYEPNTANDTGVCPVKDPGHHRPDHAIGPDARWAAAVHFNGQPDPGDRERPKRNLDSKQ